MQYCYKTLIIEEISNILQLKDLSKIRLIELIYNKISEDEMSEDKIIEKTIDNLNFYVSLIISVLKDLELNDKKKIKLKIDNKTISINLLNKDREEIMDRVDSIRKFLLFFNNRPEINRIIKAIIKENERKKEIYLKDIEYNKNKIINQIKDLELIITVREKTGSHYDNNELREKIRELNQELSAL